MSTAKQIAANRRNAQKATGPRTAAGKAASRYNSIKHGLYATGEFVFDETPEDLAELAAEYHERHTPSNPEEHLLVETLVASEWRLRRMRRVETHMWECANLTVQFKNLVKGIIGGPDPCSSGDAFFNASLAFERHQRIVNSCERDFHRALRDLTARAHAPSAPQPEDSAASSPKLVPLSQKCDRPPGLSPAGARGARAADQVSPPMNEDVSRRGCFPENPETFQPESASQTQHSAANSAKLVPLGQHPQPSAPATVETMDTAAQSLLNPSTTESAHPAGAAIVGATPSS